MLVDSILDHVKPEFHKDFKLSLRKAQTFFKHSDRDPDAVLEGFSQEQSEILLIDACFAYRRISGERPVIVHVFEVWSTLTWASTWLTYGLPEESREALSAPHMQRLKSMTRQGFFAEVFPLVYTWTYSPKSTHRQSV